MVDNYIRLSGSVHNFFVPADGEVSLHYLRWVCAKALKMNHRVTTTKDMVLNDKGEMKEVHFVHIFRFIEAEEEE